MKKIVITGASGFIGRVLCKSLSNLNYNITVDISDISDVDTIVHLAARVHITHETDSDPLAAFRRVNVEGTKQLVDLAINKKVKRFIFISSLAIYVDGNDFFYPISFNEESKPNPISPYAISKWEAEQYLNDVAKKTDMEIVIIRSPLVYGSCVKANFLNLLKLTKTGLPLPVGLLNSRRSMIGVNNFGFGKVGNGNNFLGMP